MNEIRQAYEHTCQSLVQLASTLSAAEAINVMTRKHHSNVEVFAAAFAVWKQFRVAFVTHRQWVSESGQYFSGYRALLKRSIPAGFCVLMAFIAAALYACRMVLDVNPATLEQFSSAFPPKKT